jgi:hypothetical protein
MNQQERIQYLCEMKKGESEEDWLKRKQPLMEYRKIVGESIIPASEIEILFEESVNKHILFEKTWKYHFRAFPYEVNSLLFEGIDIDFDNRTVSYNPSHEDYVSTSVNNNPSQNSGFADIPVWSVFKRKKVENGIKVDGNPLLYAFKNENGWKFKAEKDRSAIVNQIVLIVDKFNSTVQYGPTVVVPSGGPLNMFLAEIIKKRNPNTKIINDLVVKMTANEVYEAVISNDFGFREVYNTKEKFLSALDKLEKSIVQMEKQRNGDFTYHFIGDPVMREAIGQTLKLSYDFGMYSNDVNGKDILIIDDSISQGNSIKNACEVLKDSFVPNSITVLTLFSKL